MIDGENRTFERPPRIQPVLPIGEQEILSPPERNSNNQFSLLDALLPATTVIGYVVMGIAGQGRNLFLMIPMTIAMMASIYLSWRRMREGEREFQERLTKYKRDLSQMREEMRQHHQLQRDFYNYNYPLPDVIHDLVINETNNRYGWRLWERRSTDLDFGVFRLGTGTRPSHYTYLYKPKEGSSSPAADDARRLGEDSQFLTNAPITVSMRRAALSEKSEDKSNTTSSTYIHSLAIYAHSSEKLDIGGESGNHLLRSVADYANSLVMQFVSFHAPNHANLYVIGTRKAKQRWAWARDLPHARTQRNQSLLCFEGDLTSSSEDEINTESRLKPFLRSFRTLLQGRQQRMSDKDAGDVTLPFITVVVDLLEDVPAAPGDASLSEIVISDEAITTILHEGHNLGVSIIFILPSNTYLPSEVQGIIELEVKPRETIFRYSEVGVNTQRYVGTADPMLTLRSEDTMRKFGRQLQTCTVRASTTASLASSVDLLRLNNVNDIDALNIEENWQRSLRLAEWPSVPIGLKVGGESRSLTFSADADGVHGMIAGTTGSGKSELLLTLIVGLALKYDPSVVNFVLVDFKGGAAFEEFSRLPHCVDIVTNLEGNAVDRMFNAIKAELDRRSKLIADYKVKHIREYREKGYHLPEKSRDEIQKQVGKPLDPQPFPNLFIIIDEFAEMVAANPEFKTQLDSITRLGRAIGVSLILATQRPTGMVTDQMRANMKFKICLRVETPDDSRELLRRGDAAYLPTSIPGRAYIQIGNELPEIIQVARAGGPYDFAPDEVKSIDHDEQVAKPRVIWKTRHRSRKVNTNSSLSSVLVGRMDAIYREKRREPQQKPWPDPLPSYLPASSDLNNLPFFSPSKLLQFQRVELSAASQNSGFEATLVLQPALRLWYEDKGEWPSRLRWNQALQPILGFIDHPRAAHQRLLTLDLPKSNVAVFSASGWGKTTFLQTLIVALAATHSPEHLHIYILDFGKRNLEVFDALPHVGAIISSEDSERFKRLLRYLSRVVDERARHLSQEGAKDFIAYNANRNTSNVPLPAILVVIDNFAELRENFENHLPALLRLMRDGRTVGVYFAASADLPGAIPSRIYNQFGQKIVLRMTDANEYSTVVGRGNMIVPEIKGRGLIAVERDISDEPLEVQIASPVGLEVEELAAALSVDGQSESESQRRIITERISNLLSAKVGSVLTSLAQDMADKWAGKEHPPKMGILEPYYSLPTVWDTHKAESSEQLKLPIRAVIGIDDELLKPLSISLRDNPHFIILGPPLSGRSTLIRTWMLSLAERYSPDEVLMVLIDPQDRIIESGWQDLLKLPNLLEYIPTAKKLGEFLEQLEFEYDFGAPKEISDAIERTSYYTRILDSQLTLYTQDIEQARRELTTAETTLNSNRANLAAKGLSEQQYQTWERLALDAETALRKAKDALKKANSKKKMIEDLQRDWQRQLEEWKGAMPVFQRPEIYIFIDNFDDIDDITTDKNDEDKKLADLARNYRRDGLHFVLCGSEEVMRSTSELKRNVWQSRYGFAFRTSAMAERLQGNIPRELRDVDLVNGRGFLVRSSLATLVQVAEMKPAQLWQSDSFRPTNRERHAAWLRSQVPGVVVKLYELSRELEDQESVVGFQVKEIQIVAYSQRIERNKAQPYYSLLRNNLHKLSPDLLDELGLQGDNDETELSFQDIYARNPKNLQTLINGGILLLPETISEDLAERIRNRIDIYDKLIENGNLLRLSHEILLEIGINPDSLRNYHGLAGTSARDRLHSALIRQEIRIPEFLSPALKSELQKQAEIGGLLDIEVLVTLAPKIIEDLEITLNGKAIDRFTEFYKQNEHRYDFVRLRELVSSADLHIPTELNQTQREQIQNYRLVRGVLDAGRLGAIETDRLQNLGVTMENAALEDLKTMSIDDIQSFLDTHQIGLPEYLGQDELKSLRRIKPRR